MPLPSLMQEKAALDTQRQTMESSVRQTEIMQRVYDSISNQRKDFSDYHKDFNEFRKSIIRGNDDRRSLTNYIQNIKSTNNTADKAKGKEESGDYLKTALNKLMGARNDGTLQLQQKIAEDTRMTREYSVRMAASLDILAKGQDEGARERERDLLSTAIAEKIDVGSGIEQAIVMAMGALGRGLLTALGGVGAAAAAAVTAAGAGILAKMGIAAGAAMIPGNIGQEKDPMAQANEAAELERRRSMMPEHLKPQAMDQSGRLTSSTDPRIPGNRPEEKEPSMREKIGAAGEMIAGGGLMFMKKNPIVSATMALGGVALKAATGEEVKPEDVGINASKEARDAEAVKVEESTKNSRLRRFVEANSLKEMKDALFGPSQEDAREKDSGLQSKEVKVQPTQPEVPTSSKLAPVTEATPNVQAVQEQAALAEILKKESDTLREMESAIRGQNVVTVNNVNTNNVSGGTNGGGMSWPSVKSSDNDPVVQYYQKYMNTIMGIK